MLSTMADWLFGCSHRHTGFPITPLRRGATEARAPEKLGTYVVCLDCAKQFPYDWATMRITKPPAAEAARKHAARFSTEQRLFGRPAHPS